VLTSILPVQYLFNLSVQASKQAVKLTGKQSIKQAIAQANDQTSNRLSKYVPVQRARTMAHASNAPREIRKHTL